jgi:hypothetical protein
MKKLYLIILVFIGFTSCEVMDVEPTQSISTNQAITDKTGVIQALTGCYDALQFNGYYGRNYVIAGDLSSDNGTATGTIKEYKEIANNSLLADNAIVEGIWADIYIAINRVNNVIYYLPNIDDLTVAERNDFLGQAKFLRALHHFNLMRLYGMVPLKDKPSLSVGTELSTPRFPLNELYNFIISDLTFAEANISNTTKTKASKLAATSLLSIVYLYKSEWTNAKAKATEVILNTNLQLSASYSALFGGSATNTEAIMYVAYDVQDKNRLAEYFLPTLLGGRKEVSPSASLISAFDTADARKAATIAGSLPDAYVKKYLDISTGTDKVYILRLAEMFLIRAEAECNLNGNITDIQADINKIRNRAGLANTNAVSIADLKTEVEIQRRLEFAFEGHRWFDLVRTNRAMNFKPTVTQACQMLFPIPLSEIQTNDKIGPQNQNPCY